MQTRLFNFQNSSILSHFRSVNHVVNCLGEVLIPSSTVLRENLLNFTKDNYYGGYFKLGYFGCFYFFCFELCKAYRRKKPMQFLILRSVGTKQFWEIPLGISLYSKIKVDCHFSSHKCIDTIQNEA